MEINHEIKKIVLDGNLNPLATVEFKVKDYKDLGAFKTLLQQFVNQAKDQKTLNK